MNKVICDVCGTSYPETAQQCPICGCAAGQGIRVVEIDDEEAAPRASAKGGHFTKSNVRKRTKAAAAGAAPARYDEPDPPQKNGDSNKGLLIAVVALLLAIIAVIIFIVVRFGPEKQDKDKNKQTTGSTVSDQTDPTVPCTKLTVETSLVELSAVGETQKLSVNIEPANSTDKVVYTPSDPSIIRVADDGTVEALAPGQAIITVSCGQFQVKCRVVCNFGINEETIPDITEDPNKPTDPSEPPAPTDPTTPPQTDPPEEETFKLKKSDVTLFKPGEKWVAYSGSISLSKIKWTSDDESIAKVENGTVVAVAPGTTKIHGEYNGVKSTCIIRCRWSEETDPSGETTAPTDPSATTDPSETTEPKTPTETYKISHEDVTIKIGETFKLTLKDSNGKEVTVQWQSLNTNICFVNGNVVEGKSVGTTYVKCDYNGQGYVCIVRVKKA